MNTRVKRKRAVSVCPDLARLSMAINGPHNVGRMAPLVLWLGLDRSALHAVERRARRDRRLIEKYLRDHPVVRVLAPSVVHLGRCDCWCKAVADPNVETAILEARRSLRDEGGRWKLATSERPGMHVLAGAAWIVEGPELAELTGAIAADLGGVDALST